MHVKEIKITIKKYPLESGTVVHSSGRPSLENYEFTGSPICITRSFLPNPKVSKHMKILFGTTWLLGRKTLVGDRTGVHFREETNRYLLTLKKNWQKFRHLADAKLFSPCGC